MSLSRRGFVRTLGAGSAGAVALAWMGARGREARAGIALVETAPPRAIRLDSNENPYGPGPAALQAIDDATAAISRYPDEAEERLAETLARWHGVPPGSILLGCGSTEILRMAARQLTAPGRGLVTAAPSFEAPNREAEKNGASVAAIPVDPALKLDLAGMSAAASGAGLVYVCNPNNPTGTVHPAQAIKDFISRVHGRSSGTCILIDEAYHEYVDDPGYATSIPLAMENPRVLVSRTFSKIYGLAGLRVGYAVGRRETIESISPQRLESGVNALGAAAALAVLNRAEQVQRQRELNREAKEFTAKWFESAGYQVTPSQANFIMVEIRRDPREFRDECRKLGVWVGRAFPPLITRARITIGTLDEMKTAVEVFGQVLGVGRGHA